MRSVYGREPQLFVCLGLVDHKRGFGMRKPLFWRRAARARPLPPPSPSSESRQGGWDGRLCGSTVASVLLIGIVIGCYAHPMADDFARAYKGRVQGVFPAVMEEYFTWSGRWASGTIDYLLTSRFDLVRVYPLLLGMNAALLACCVYALLSAARVGVSQPQRFALTISLLALYWVGMPDPGETFYWLTGGIDNLSGLALSVLLLSGLLRERAQTTVPTGVWLSLLAFTATGFHELFGLLLCLTLAGGTLKMWLECDPRRQLWTICLAAAFVGFILVYTAPGNALRQAEFPLARHLALTLRLSLKQGVMHVIRWGLDVRLLSATALLVMLPPATWSAQGQATAANKRALAIVAMTWILAVAAGFVAASWATGTHLILRTLNGIYFVFVAGWFFVVVSIAQQFAKGGEPLIAFSAPLRRVTVAFFIASMLLTGNTSIAMTDLRSSVPNYSRAMHERWRALYAARARGEEDAIVTRLPVRPRIFIRYFEVRDDPEYWENKSVACYFGLRTVRLAPD